MKVNLKAAQFFSGACFDCRTGRLRKRDRGRPLVECESNPSAARSKQVAVKQGAYRTRSDGGATRATGSQHPRKPRRGEIEPRDGAALFETMQIRCLSEGSARSIDCDNEARFTRNGRPGRDGEEWKRGPD